MTRWIHRDSQWIRGYGAGEGRKVNEEVLLTEYRASVWGDEKAFGNREQ